VRHEYASARSFYYDVLQRKQMVHFVTSCRAGFSKVSGIALVCLFVRLILLKKCSRVKQIFVQCVTNRAVYSIDIFEIHC